MHIANHVFTIFIKALSFSDRVTATRGVTLKPLQRRTHQPRWDSLVIPPTWNYKGVRVKGARFDNTGNLAFWN